MSTFRSQLPELTSGYDDAYGLIDLSVYEAAQEIWPSASAFGEFALQDPETSFNLIFKAAANVTARLRSHPNSIDNLSAYLFQTYKHLVAEEKSKRLTRQQPLNELDEALVVDIITDIEDKILLRELFLRMTDEDKVLANYLMFGYTYEEIAERLGKTDDALRKRFSRLKERLQEVLASKGDK